LHKGFSDKFGQNILCNPEKLLPLTPTVYSDTRSSLLALYDTKSFYYLFVLTSLSGRPWLHDEENDRVWRQKIYHMLGTFLM